MKLTELFEGPLCYRIDVDWNEQLAFPLVQLLPEIWVLLLLQIFVFIVLEAEVV